MLALGLAGCAALMPGKKEFFQKEVPAYPTSPSLEEKRREAATYVAEKVNTAYDEGLKANTTNSVMEPLQDAREVAAPLAASLGPPQKPYQGDGAALAKQLQKLEANLDAKLRKLEDKLSGVQGKDIEGTGLIQMGYFTWLAVLGGIIALLWFVLRIVSLFNPPVALGMSVASTGVGLVRRGFSEVIEAGEKFKDMVKKQVDDPELQSQVLDMFRRAQLESQSRDVQTVIKQLTNNPNDPKTALKMLRS